MPQINDVTNENALQIAQVAVARDRCERAVHLLGGIIEDWAGQPPEHFDNRERLRQVAAALYDALTRVYALAGDEETT